MAYQDIRMTSATHRAFGLTWAIPFDFPPFAVVEDGGPADIVVVEQDVPRPAADANWAGPLRAVEGSQITFGMPDAARMLITDGNRIAFERHDTCTEESLRLLLMGPGAALLLHQRGRLPLHGSGIVTEKGAILLVGHSGAGKSTTLGALMDRGYPVLCDDLAAVDLDASGRAVVYPGTQVMKVWSDSAESLGWATDGLPRVRPEFEKFVVTLREQTTEAMPLVAVYQLSTHNEPDVVLTPKTSTAKFNALLDHTWQKMTVKRMGLHGQHFERIVAVANQVRVVQVKRPVGVPIDENGLVDMLVADFNSAG
jgi:hypothetical protein